MLELVVMKSLCPNLHFLTIGAPELHTETLLSGVGDVTLTLRTSSGDGKADGKGETESWVRDEEGDRGSKLWVESVLLWPLVRYDVRMKKK